MSDPDKRHLDAANEIMATGHLMGPWMPLDNNRKRRACLIGCGHVEKIKVK